MITNVDWNAAPPPIQPFPLLSLKCIIHQAQMEAANKFRSAEMMAQVTGQLCDIIFPIGIYYMNRLIEEG